MSGPPAKIVCQVSGVARLPTGWLMKGFMGESGLGDPLELRELLELWLEMLDRGLATQFAAVPGRALPSWLQMLERGLASGAAWRIAPSSSWLTTGPYRESE
ncbi:hypothetical protein EYF80_021426 [Liparis tanakae]|uniref:Uncharacterized protein n=1 Tax=Liparis tanakae TaxID=230148 RepID=A0A4Z2HTU7_9TELE|nr:hypothetical protein EYF80_021426 [Liparis tanakae]